MATLSNLPGALSAGTNRQIGLDPSQLITNMGITDAQFSNHSNWQAIEFEYNDATSSETQWLVIHADSLLGYLSFSEKARTNRWTVKRIIIRDDAGGEYLINRESFPNQTEFDLDVVSTSASPGTYDRVTANNESRVTTDNSFRGTV